MKFVDEAIISVIAGKGGNGCASFRREKFVPFGGPNGGDGGAGGSIFLVADSGLNTLVDFRYQRQHRAANGENGRGSDCYGKSGDDLWVKVPVGTVIYDVDTQEMLGDLIQAGQTLKVAQGGTGGLGNLHFKSSVNRAPRQCTKGTEGEKRTLRLELKVLAEVGLLGLPNAGKSTFIRAVSAARPKVADYPFTTLYPQLGVVAVSPYRSFVIADIPGVIAGAAEGAGLGLQFLRHLQRTRLLLHIVDILPIDGSDPVTAIRQVTAELNKFSAELAQRPRWLVFNKVDLVPEEMRPAHIQRIVETLAWEGPVYTVSALSGFNTKPLIHDLMVYLEANA